MPRYEYHCPDCWATETITIMAKNYDRFNSIPMPCASCNTGHLKRVFTPFTFKVT